MTKTLNQIIFFPPPKSEYFFQQHWESEYFFRKKNIPPPPPPLQLNGRSLKNIHFILISLWFLFVLSTNFSLFRKIIM